MGMVSPNDLTPLANLERRPGMAGGNPRLEGTSNQRDVLANPILKVDTSSDRRQQ